MVNQQLLDYVKQQLKNNVSREQIKSSLMENGWDNADVEEGFAVLSPAPAPKPSAVPQSPRPAYSSPSLNPTIQPVSSFTNPQRVQPTFIAKEKSPAWKKIFLFLIILAVLAGAGWGAYIYFNKPKTENKAETSPLSKEGSQNVTPVTPPANPASNPDVVKVEAILSGDMREGYLTANKALIIKHASVKTAAFLASAKLPRASSFTVNKISKSGLNILANFTAVTAGKTEVQDMVFIREGGDWKFDLEATMLYLMEKENAETGN